MRNFIGGLFKDRSAAELARKALLENGIEPASINMLECTNESKAVIDTEKPPVQSVGKGVLIGALLLGGLGALLGALVGFNVIHIPTLEPLPGATLPFEITWQYVLTSVATGTIFGVVTGAILGAYIRLALVPNKTVDISHGVQKGDVMVAVEADDIRKETKAKMTMKEYGARKFEEFRETWDTEVWSVARDEAPQAR